MQGEADADVARYKEAPAQSGLKWCNHPPQAGHGISFSQHAAGATTSRGSVRAQASSDAVPSGAAFGPRVSSLTAAAVQLRH